MEVIWGKFNMVLRGRLCLDQVPIGWIDRRRI